MKCIYCGTGQAYVRDAVRNGKAILRLRKCSSCGQKFYTEESIVIKDTELRKNFWKMRNGVM